MLRLKHYSYITEKSYLAWIKRFLVFHGRRSPRELGKDAVEQFLTHLAVNHKVSPSTQNQALNSIVFLYKDVLSVDLGQMSGIEWAKKRERIVEHFTKDEISLLIPKFTGTSHIIASLMYGSGLRLAEALRLRIKDVNFDDRQILVRDSKGQKDRVVMLPINIIPLLINHISRVKVLHESDRKDGFGSAPLPYSLEKKYPRLPWAWHWQYVFPSIHRSKDPRSGIIRRHHLFPSYMQK